MLLRRIGRASGSLRSSDMQNPEEVYPPPEARRDSAGVLVTVLQKKYTQSP